MRSLSKKLATATHRLWAAPHMDNSDSSSDDSFCAESSRFIPVARHASGIPLPDHWIRKFKEHAISHEIPWLHSSSPIDKQKKSGNDRSLFRYPLIHTNRACVEQVWSRSPVPNALSVAMSAALSSVPPRSPRQVVPDLCAAMTAALASVDWQTSGVADGARAEATWQPVRSELEETWSCKLCGTTNAKAIFICSLCSLAPSWSSPPEVDAPEVARDIPSIAMEASLLDAMDSAIVVVSEQERLESPSTPQEENSTRCVTFVEEPEVRFVENVRAEAQSEELSSCMTFALEGVASLEGCGLQESLEDRQPTGDENDGQTATVPTPTTSSKQADEQDVIIVPSLSPIQYQEVQDWVSAQAVDPEVQQRLRDEFVVDRGRCRCLARPRRKADIPRLDKRLWEAKDRVLSLMQTDFSFGADAHWRMLWTVHFHLTTNRACESVRGKHWEAIGFKGSDPESEFNSFGGVLNLLHLVCFLSHCSHEKKGSCPHVFEAAYASIQKELARFPIADVSIRVTSMVLESFLAGELSAVCNTSLTNIFETVCRMHAAALLHLFRDWWESRRDRQSLETSVSGVQACLKKSPTKLLAEFEKVMANKAGSPRRLLVP